MSRSSATQVPHVARVLRGLLGRFYVPLLRVGEAPKKRSEIAKKAAVARWDDTVRQAIAGSPDQPLKIGDIEIQCYVLDDGTRVLTQGDFLVALGRHRRANVKPSSEGGEERVPPIMQGKAIRPFITKEIRAKSAPITFRLPHGGRASGYNALLLPEVCEVYLAARAAEVLPSNQERIAAQAEILVRGLARVGIIALVDEATGYEKLKATRDLARILETFIAKELQPWGADFPGRLLPGDVPPA